MQDLIGRNLAHYRVVDKIDNDRQRRVRRTMTSSTAP
jgi:hypothetical protein